MRTCDINARFTEDGEETLRVSLASDCVVIDAGPQGKVLLDPEQWAAVLNEWSRYTALRNQIAA